MRERMPATLLRRIWHLLNRERLERELEEEMAAHRDHMAPEDRARFGSTLRLRERARDAWGWNWLDALVQDFRFGCRVLLRTPAFTASIVSVLALGIGVTLTLFQVFDVLVLRSLPVSAPENLFEIHRRGPDSLSTVLSYPEYEFIRDRNRTLSAVFAQMHQEVQTRPDGGLPAAASFVTSNYLAELGARPASGRILAPAVDGVPGAAASVVLGHTFWQQHFGSDPLVVGRVILVDGRPATIVGVTAPGFNGTGWSTVDLWIPIEQHFWFFPGSDLLASESKRPLLVSARLRPGTTKTAAEAGLRSVIAGFRGIYPNAVGANQWLECAPAGQAIRLGPHQHEPLLFVVALVVLVLAVSFSNAGALQLSRSLVRTREMWIRASLGAGRPRLVRQLVTESLVIALAASVVGLVIAHWGTTAILLSLETPLSAGSIPSGRVVAAAAALALCAAVLAGAAPALRGVHRPSASHRLRGMLIGVQVMASCVLLIVASLWARGLQHVLSSPLGFEYHDVILIDPNLSARGYSPERAQWTIRELRQRAAAAPATVSASVCSTAPLGGWQWIDGIRGASGQLVMAQVNAVDPDYFETMRIALLTGRTFRPGERDAAIVSQSLATRAWPGENPLGKLLDGGKVIVGVAASARAVALRNGESVEIYYPSASLDRPTNAFLVVRTVGGTRTAVRLLRAAMISPNDPPLGFTVLSDRFAEVTGGSRKGATALGIIGVLVLALTAVGIAGLLSCAVAQRTKEIGIRAALGAQSADIVRTVLAQAVAPVAVGLLLGGVGGYAVSSLMRSELYGIDLLDPGAYGVAACLLLATATLAAAAPVRRALRVNPVQALRHD